MATLIKMANIAGSQWSVSMMAISYIVPRWPYFLDVLPYQNMALRQNLCPTRNTQPEILATLIESEDYGDTHGNTKYGSYCESHKSI